MILGAQFQILKVSNLWVLRDKKLYNNNNNYNNNINNAFSCLLPIQSSVIGIKRKNLKFNCNKKPIFMIYCKSSYGSSPIDDDEDDGGSINVPHHDFLRASLLISETVMHYRMRRHGFPEDTRWRLPGRWNPFSAITKEPRNNTSFVGYEFLRRFQSPTIFLRVLCDGEFLLPIIVGEFAIEKLIDALQGGDGNDDVDCPDQFQLVRNLVDKLGYEVKMVKITERVVHTYFARIILRKHGEREPISIDARPSDAIIVANRCEAPIYVSKEIIFTDAIRISYGSGRAHDKNRKPGYDVSLDSAADGPDLLIEELELVRNMNLAVEEERFNDAAIWRDKLLQLRQSRHD